MMHIELVDIPRLEEQLNWVTWGYPSTTRLSRVSPYVSSNVHGEVQARAVVALAALPEANRSSSLGKHWCTNNIGHDCLLLGTTLIRADGIGDISAQEL